MSVTENMESVRDTDIMRAYPLYAVAMLMLILNLNEMLFATGRGAVATLVSVLGVAVVTLPLAASLLLD